MTESKPRFIWYELMTTDQDAAEAFYRAVVGWKMADAGQPGMRYTILSAGERGIGGLMALPAEARQAGAKPGWTGYIGVADTDAAAQAHRRGRRQHPPRAGRHPQRRPLRRRRRSRRRGVHAADAAAARAGAAAGRAHDPRSRGWHELYAGNGQEAAFAFYSAHFGWTTIEHDGHGRDGQVPHLRRRRRAVRRHDGQARATRRCPPGASTSTSTGSTPPWSGSRPTAARC